MEICLPIRLQAEKIGTIIVKKDVVRVHLSRVSFIARPPKDSLRF